MPETVQSAQVAPQDFLGPNVITVLVQSVETGVIINQAARFIANSWGRESWWVRGTVVFSCLVAFIQTCVAFHQFYDVYVWHFGNWMYALVPSSYDKLQNVMTLLQAVPVQTFLIWRCYKILGSRWYPIAPLIVLLLGACVMNVLLTIQTFGYPFALLMFLPLADFTGTLPVSPYFVAATTITAALDLFLTGILTIFLYRSKGQVYSKRFRTAIDRLIVFMWEGAVPPAACASATLFTYLRDVQSDNWDLMFQAATGKLYVISFFVTLNARDSMRGRSLAPATLDISNMSFRTAGRTANPIVESPESVALEFEDFGAAKATPHSRKKRLWSH